MEAYIFWAAVGLMLVVVELLTGTFYLLVLGVASFGAALVAYSGQGMGFQVIALAIVSAVGVWLVRGYRSKNAARQMAPIDRGQPGNFESWVDRSAGLARVRYRGSSWEARIEPGAGEAALESGALVYVLGTDGNTLKISTTRPA